MKLNQSFARYNTCAICIGVAAIHEYCVVYCVINKYWIFIIWNRAEERKHIAEATSHVLIT